MSGVRVCESHYIINEENLDVIPTAAYYYNEENCGVMPRLNYIIE